MSDKKVAVIMSTYNGEKYVAEQLESILHQTYSNIEIVIRDDGSRDNTVNIIKKYQKKYKNIKLYEGENVGFVKSFFKLLKLADADYYAYADQDDIWIEHKIRLAVNSLNKLDNTKPNMAFGNSDYYDENMKFLSKGPRIKKYNFLTALFSCVAQGMTMTVNRKARDMIIENMPKSCFFHDWWTYLICIGMGNVVHVDETVVKYRRRKENATSEGQGYIRLLIWRINNLLFKDGINDIKQQMINFKDYYYYGLSDENKKIISLFSSEDYTFSLALKKTFYPRRIRKNIIDDLMVRILFLIGVL